MLTTEPHGKISFILAKTRRGIHFLALFFWTSARAAELVLEIKAPSEMESFLKKELPFASLVQKDLREGVILDKTRKAKESTEEILEIHGYYGAKVEARRFFEGKKIFLRLEVLPSPKTNVSFAKLEFSGEITKNLEDLQRARNLWGLGAGKDFSETAWEAEKTKLLAALMEKKYASARLEKTLAVVDPDKSQAELEVHVDSGPVFHFGKLVMKGLNRYPPSLIERLSPIAPGEVYDQEKLLELQKALHDSGNFAGVSVRLIEDRALAAAAPIEVTVIEEKRQRVALGGGVSSDGGPRASLEYENRRFLPGSWRFLAKASGDMGEQSGEASLLRPAAREVTDRISVGALDSDISGVRTESLHAEAARIRENDHFRQSTGLVFLHSDSNAEDVRSTNVSSLSFVESLMMKRLDDEVFPHRGWSVSGLAGGGLEQLLSDASFFRLQGKAMLYLPWGEKNTFIFRGELGRIFVDDPARVPNNFLFRTGGSQSVRGYRYQGIGENVPGAVLPAKTVVVASGEWQRWLTRRWGIALFFDVGEAKDDFSRMSLKKGYGAGARWRSPVGPVNVDLAWGEERQSIEVHFGFGVGF